MRNPPNDPARTRADIRRAYKQQPRRSGIYQIRNAVTGKVLLGSSTNLHGPLNKHRFMLSIGRHDNPALQADWNRYGGAAFSFDVLDVVQIKDDPLFCLEDELTLLEQIWIDKLQPYGERGYNLGPIRRD